MGKHAALHDGKVVCVGTEFECLRHIQRSQSQSFDWARKYGGWDVVETGVGTRVGDVIMDNAKEEWSKK